MNFVLHAHLAESDHGDPAVTLGAMLPDLWRMVARPARSKRGVSVPGVDPALASILAGVEHHLEVDRWFHESRHFRLGEAATTEALGTVPRELSPRLRLFGHVTWEMCLDGALVRRLGVPSLARTLSRAVREGTTAAERAAELHHGEARRAAGLDDAVFEERMGRLLEAVSSFALPEGYAYAEGVAARLAGIRRALGIGYATSAERARWAEALAAIEPLADEAVAALLADETRARATIKRP